MPNTDPPEPSVYDKYRAMFAGRFTKYRAERLAEVIPTELFPVRRKSYYLMKEMLMLKPNGPRYLVKRMDPDRPKSSLIEIPDTVEGEGSMQAIVIAVGTKCVENVKVADTVFIAKYCGAPVTVDLDGESLEALLVMETDVLGVLED